MGSCWRLRLGESEWRQGAQAARQAGSNRTDFYKLLARHARSALVAFPRTATVPAVRHRLAAGIHRALTPVLALAPVFEVDEPAAA